MRLLNTKNPIKKITNIAKEIIKDSIGYFGFNLCVLYPFNWYLFDLARENQVAILYEAAVAGGIPIILPIKTSLAANKFSFVAGILANTAISKLSRSK